MERKIGEIFEYNGEWYQCVEHKSCEGCAFYRRCSYKDKFGNCSSRGRKDKKSVIFKKLEKVGEPYMTGNKLIQRYKIYPTTCCINVYGWYYQNLDVKSWTIDIEIKQRKEDMEEKNESAEEISIRIANEFEEKLEKHFKEYMDKIDTSNLKPFDLQKAKEGKPVCTRDGRKARILCYDFKQNEEYPILVAVENKNGKECPLLYSNDGISEMYKSSNNELAILPKKKEGWLNVYKERCYETKEEAISCRACNMECIDTIKVEWEE